MQFMTKNLGIFIALLIITSWFFHLAFWINQEIDFKNPWIYLAILIQTHLYTGLFISSHDSIHGVVSTQYPTINRIIGRICTVLFAFNNYSLLSRKHHLHHAHVNTEKDPDVHQGNFFLWWFKFILQYVHWSQILAMAIAYNVLKIWFPMENLILFWELPAILSTLQLFYFGTYLPHRGAHSMDNIHQSRSQKKNDLWAFISCYFFGYHYEHHAFPYLPWWKLASSKKD
ncbi:fatty acid desaturase [Aquirufa sp. ROCK-SH2]